MATEIITDRTITDLVTNGVEAYGIASLLMWIAEARTLIEKVRDCADLDSDLREILRRRNVRIAMAEWVEETSDGMDMLLLKHRATIREMANTAESLEASQFAEKQKPERGSMQAKNAHRREILRTEALQD